MEGGGRGGGGETIRYLDRQAEADYTQTHDRVQTDSDTCTKR